MRFHIIGAAMAAGLLASCGDGREKLAGAGAASGDVLVDYSAKVTHGVSLDKDAPFFQRFCMNMTGSLCPENIGDKLSKYGFSNGKTGIDLGYAFAQIAADEKDGSADAKSSDADFIEGAYKAAFGRSADPSGIETYSAVIKDGSVDSRKVMIRTLLQSREFKSLK